MKFRSRSFRYCAARIAIWYAGCIGTGLYLRPLRGVGYYYNKKCPTSVQPDPVIPSLFHAERPWRAAADVQRSVTSCG